MYWRNGSSCKDLENVYSFSGDLWMCGGIQGGWVQLLCLGLLGVPFVLRQGCGSYVHGLLTSFCSLFSAEPMKRHSVGVWATRPWGQTCPLCGESHVMVLWSALTVLLAFARRCECRSAPIKNNNSRPAQLGTGTINLMKVAWAGMAELMVRWLRDHIFWQGTHSAVVSGSKQMVMVTILIALYLWH